jgi:hypothetical protein
MGKIGNRISSEEKSRKKQVLKFKDTDKILEMREPGEKRTKNKGKKNHRQKTIKDLFFE